MMPTGKTASARKNGAFGFKALVVYPDGRTHVPVRLNFKERESALAYAQKWIDANDNRPRASHTKFQVKS
jgi:hypothetical protein